MKRDVGKTGTKGTAFGFEKRVYSGLAASGHGRVHNPYREPRSILVRVVLEDYPCSERRLGLALRVFRHKKKR
jgi:hypothetical protein